MLASAALDQFAAEPLERTARVKLREPRPKLAVIKTDAPSLLESVTAAVRDPAISIEKLNVLAGLYERAKADDARKAFSIAMNAAQTAMSPIAANAVNDAFDSQYATYAALDRVMRPLYTAHGFTVGFTTESSDLQRHQRVVIILTHVDGHRETHRADFPADGLDDAGETVQTLIHAAASAMTYAQRYLLGLAFNIAVAKDGDGNMVQRATDVITADQVSTLTDLIARTGGGEAQFLALLKVPHLSAIPPNRFEHAVWLLNQRKAA